MLTEKICAEIARIRRENPNLRIGQIVSNAGNGADTYYSEDNVLLEQLRAVFPSQNPMETPAARHPVQPIVMVDGVERFKQNAIVRWLLDRDMHILNKIAMDFSREDQEQFYQLTGHSLSGFGGLPFVSAETVARADLQVTPLDELEPGALFVENQVLRAKLRRLTEAYEDAQSDDNGNPW